MDRMHMDATTSLVALPVGHSTTVTARTFIVVGLTFVTYYLLRFVYFAYIYPFYVSPLRHLPTPKVRSILPLPRCQCGWWVPGHNAM